MSIQLQSPAFGPNQHMPRKYTGDGENVSPPIKWSGLPPGTRELALIVDDPDAPMAEPFVHWVIYKIPSDSPGLPEQLPKSPKPRTPDHTLQGKNTYRHIGYDGPAPPPGHGLHHYHFRVYALDKPLEVETGLDNKSLLASMSGHILDTGELVGTYERPA